MTPFAHKIAKELTLPVRKRTFVDHPNLPILPHIERAHCFEVTDVYPLAEQLGRQVQRIVDGPLTTFLPASQTWIEWAMPLQHRGPGLPDLPSRMGMYLVEAEAVAVAGNATYVSGYGAVPVTDEIPSCVPVPGARGTLIMAGLYRDVPAMDRFGWLAEPWPIDLRIGPIDYDTVQPKGFQPDTSVPGSVLNLVPAFLLLINSPKVIGRRQHMPHAGLQRRLAAARGMTGKFPLHAWTEIKLEVTTPRDASGEPVAEGHLTGQRALHFCRTHVRVRLGRLEIVRSHWRGDPSLGLKQARYKVTA